MSKIQDIRKNANYRFAIFADAEIQWLENRIIYLAEIKKPQAKDGKLK